MTKIKTPLHERVKSAIASKDCDDIPKVKNAGETIGTKQPIQIMHNGLKVYQNSYVGEWMSQLITLMKGHHEPQEEKMFYQVLKSIKPNGTMIELGSNWAYYSMWFNKNIKNAKNILIEPSIEALNLGKKHFKLNKMDGIFIHGLVGSESISKVDYTDYHNQTHQLPQFTIDQLIKKHKIKSLDILHSDIQGAEFDMLHGALSSIKNHKIKFIFISTHGDKHFKCLYFLKKHGYTILAQHNIRESATADGLIVATILKDISLDTHFTGLKTLTLKQKVYNLYEEIKAIAQTYGFI